MPFVWSYIGICHNSLSPELLNSVSGPMASVLCSLGPDSNPGCDVSQRGLLRGIPLAEDKTVDLNISMATNPNFGWIYLDTGQFSVSICIHM
jgi:hypothetical protein